MLVTVERADGIATVTLNRPEAMNSLNTQLRSELTAVFAQLDARDDVRVIIITGASDGIGAELARRLAPEKPKLVLAARRLEALQIVAGQCATAGADVLVAGSAVFARGALAENIAALKASAA